MLIPISKGEWRSSQPDNVPIFEVSIPRFAYNANAYALELSRIEFSQSFMRTILSDTIFDLMVNFTRTSVPGMYFRANNKLSTKMSVLT